MTSWMAAESSARRGWCWALRSRKGMCIADRLNCYMVTWLHGYIVTLLHRYIVASLHCCIVTSLHCCIVTLFHGYIVTRLHRYMVSSQSWRGRMFDSSCGTICLTT